MKSPVIKIDHPKRKYEESKSVPDPRNVSFGLGTVPYAAEYRGWATPGGGFVYSKPAAMRLAVKLDKLLVENGYKP